LAVRPIGAQLSRVALLGAIFAWAQTGEPIKRTANTNFFIGFSQQARGFGPALEIFRSYQAAWSNPSTALKPQVEF
jgi:hypothetical protein